MTVPLSFAWSRLGLLIVEAPAEYEIVGSMLGGDLDGRRPLVAQLRDFVVEARADDSVEREFRTGEGYYVRVRGEQAVVESVLEIYPDTTYRTGELVDALDQLQQWLDAHAHERPGG